MKVSTRGLIPVHQAIRLALLCLIFLLLPSARAMAGEISRGFLSSTPLPRGTVVSIQKDNQTSVTPTNSSNEMYLVGVVTSQGGNLLELTNSSTNINVTSLGPNQVLVSDLGGVIRKGDPLAPSPISGIAMRYNENGTNQKVLGTATTDFDVSSAGSKSFEVEKLGSKTVRVGLLSSYISIADSGQWAKSEKTTSALAKTVSKIFGSNVTNLQALTGLILFITSVTVAAIILFAGVRGSFSSLGRNPMAAKAIYRSMWRVLGVTIGIVLAGSILTYMVFSL